MLLEVQVNEGDHGQDRQPRWPRSTTPRPRWRSRVDRGETGRRPGQGHRRDQHRVTRRPRRRWPRQRMKSTPRPTAGVPNTVPRRCSGESELEVTKNRSGHREGPTGSNASPPQDANVAKAELDAAEENINRRKIRSPLDGVVVERTPPQGRMGAAGRRGGPRRPHGPAVGRGLRQRQASTIRAEIDEPPGHGDRHPGPRPGRSGSAAQIVFVSPIV